MRNGEEGAGGLRVLRNKRAAGTLRSRVRRGALMSRAGTGVTTQPVMRGVRAVRCRHMVGGSHLTHAARPLAVDCILGVPDIRCCWSALGRRTAPALHDWWPLLLLFADASPVSAGSAAASLHRHADTATRGKKKRKAECEIIHSRDQHASNHMRARQKNRRDLRWALRARAGPT